MSNSRPIFISNEAYRQIAEALKPEERFWDQNWPGLTFLSPNGTKITFCPKEDRPVAAGITDPTKD